MAGHGAIAANAFILSRLAANASVTGAVAARIYSHAAPPMDPATGTATGYPLVVYVLRPLPSVMPIGSGAPLLQRFAASVYAIGKDGFAALATCASGIDTALEVSTPVSISDGVASWWCTSEHQQPIFDSAVEVDERYFRAGGEYKILVDPA